MDHKQRYKKVRLLIGKLNKERKKQARKVDILCNDLIAAQGDFIKKLGTISFTATFYGSIVGTTDLNSLLYTACKFIKEEIADANIAFFLQAPPTPAFAGKRGGGRQPVATCPRHGGQENFELHMFESDQPITLEEQRLESCFTPELVDNICKSNKLCTLDDMFAMELQGNLIMLNKTSAVTIPLGQLGSSLGFILIYRSSEHKLTADELKTVAAVTPGLSRAIQSCRVLSLSTD